MDSTMESDLTQDEVNLTPQAQDSTVPSDIQHIIHLGADEPDNNQLNSTDYEQVVRDLKERAGFVQKEEIEQEMENKGLPRPEPMRGFEQGPEDMQLLEAQPEATEEQEQQVKRDTVEEGVQGMQIDTDQVSVAVLSTGEEKDGQMLPPSIPTPKAKASIDDSDSDLSSDPSSSSDSDSDATTSSQLPPRTRKRGNGKKNKASSTTTKEAHDSDLSDDDINLSHGTAPKTEHEVLPEGSVPDIESVDDSVEINRFGTVVSVIENVVVLKADTAGDWRVLDEGTIVCWENRKVAGSIFETFGSVQQPFYSLRFPTSSPPDPTLFTTSKPIFYAPKLASFVFTRDIRAIKGSDASNLYDEEVGQNEMEWSDDEAEQEYKRSQKAKWAHLSFLALVHLVTDSKTDFDCSRRSRTASATPAPSSRASSAAPSHLPSRPILSYEDDSYTPLQRPQNLHLVGEEPPRGGAGRKMFERDTGANGSGEKEFEFSDEEAETGSVESFVDEEERNRSSARGGRGRGGERGRGGDRGRGGRGRGDRGRGRGGASRGGGAGQDDRRAVAPLPSRSSQSTLPSRPDFNPQIPHAHPAPQFDDRRPPPPLQNQAPYPVPPYGAQGGYPQAPPSMGYGNYGPPPSQGQAYNQGPYQYPSHQQQPYGGGYNSPYSHHQQHPGSGYYPPQQGYHQPQSPYQQPQPAPFDYSTWYANGGMRDGGNGNGNGYQGGPPRGGWEGQR